ncbi:MAG TPA: phosphotransferase family protein [Actinocrinis sp.]|nr:phosphotransferase family protein [Actinocrinis sp.]
MTVPNPEPPSPTAAAPADDSAAPAQSLPGLDLSRLRAHLDVVAPGLVAGPLSGAVIAGGRSNLTYAVTDGAQRWAVRRPPLGHVLATAHDMGREYRVMSALAPTAVPVPETVAYCADPDVIGAPFYVMQYVDGAVYRLAEDTADLAPDRRAAMTDALVDVLAALHEVDPAAVGLADFGRPDGFLERQVRRWKTQLDASRSRPLAGADALHAGLAASIPASARACLLHGDYRLDNVLVGADDQVAAVLDWEMSTLGDPLTDLALFLVYYAGLGAARGSAVTVTGSPAPGFPSGADLAARYARRHPVDLSRLDWYLALAFFKLAVISEGIHLRFSTGQTVGAGFEQIGQTVEPLLGAGNAALARDTAARADPARAHDPTRPGTAAGPTTEEEQPACPKP